MKKRTDKKAFYMWFPLFVWEPLVAQSNAANISISGLIVNAVILYLAEKQPNHKQLRAVKDFCDVVSKTL